MNEQLPAFVLAALFADDLVYTGEKLHSPEDKTFAGGPGKNEPLPPSKKYLGNYERKIIVLVNDDKHTYLSDGELEFLSGILNACKLNLAHIALINFNNNPLDFIQLKETMQPQCLLAFGINALEMQLPFDMPDYQVQQYNNCSIVTAPALSVMNNKTPEAKTEKTKLWKSLQKIFNLEK